MKVLLGVSGSIAAYKACDIITKLRHHDHEVRVILTESAKELVSEVTLATLSGHPCISDFWVDAKKGSIDHIDVSQEWADLLVVAPATTNMIAKFALGIADDYLSTTFTSANCPKMVAPAMNTSMLHHKPTQRNLQLLRDDGVEIIESDSGRLACGTVGEGKLRNVDDIVAAILEFAESTK